MRMSNEVLLIFSLVLIILFIFFYIVLKNKKIVLIISFVVVSIIFIFILFNKFNNKDYYDITQVSLSENLRVEKEGDSLVLYSNNTLVTYHNGHYKSSLNIYNLIYFQEFDNFYILVFSDKIVYNENYLYKITLSSQAKQYVYVLYKDSLELINLSIMRSYNLVGCEIDFSKTISNNSYIVFQVYENNSRKITKTLAFYKYYSHYRKKYMLIETSLKNNLEFNETYESVVLFKNYLLTITSLKNLELNNISVNVVEEEYSMYYSSSDPNISILKDQEYIKNGYFTVIDEVFYYVNNDLKICRLNKLEEEVIESVISLENWIEQLGESL